MQVGRSRQALAGLAIAVLVLTSAIACGRGSFFRQYEYEEEMYLSLDGTATVYVNSSIAALNALRGTAFNADPAVDVDRNAVRDYFTTPLTTVNGRVTTSRRNNRRYVHVRVDVSDVRKLGAAAPFSWSQYEFGAKGDVFAFCQHVAAPAKPAAASGARWSGDEVVAFRLHVPSKVRFHNAGAANLRRGNILVWEQALQDRLRGAPIDLEARMDKESILYRTLWLFAGTVGAVAILFVLVILWVVRRGGRPGNQSPRQPSSPQPQPL